MESQFTAKNLKINNIGEVLIIVEGEVYEYKLLKHIFTEVLDYNYIAVGKGNIIRERYQSKYNKNSKITVVNTNSSNVKSVLDIEGYIDRLYELVMKEYGRSLKNVRTYFIWDRDVESNDKEVTNKALNIFTNSWDNENYEMNGLLLLSYPCVEIFTLSNFEKMLYKKKFQSSLEVKRYIKSLNFKKFNISNITEETLLLTVENMNRVLKTLDIREYDTSYFSKVNLKVFEEQTKFYNIDGCFKALSLISVLLIDLGIIDCNIIN